MNIVVCVKYVPDASVDRHFEADRTVDRGHGQLSELDEYAVEQVLKIKEKLSDSTEITVLSLGPHDAAEAIRKALQMGADKAVHVLDETVAGSDALATSLVLADAVRRLDPDLVVCGMASTDAGTGVLPAMMAERLGIPAVTFGSEVELDGATVRIRRDGDAATETVEAALPLILSVTDQSGEARYPTFKGIMAAKKKPVETWSLADLGIEAELVGLSAAWAVVDAVEARPPRTAGEIVTDEDGSGADALVEFLASTKFVAGGKPRDEGV